jgi:hypothetical protein
MKPVALYSTCAACAGHGRIATDPDGPRSVVCPKCRGAGTTPTEDGKAIIGLVRAARVEGLLPGE